MNDSPYLVGYGRPPGHTRFRKGQSGNPGGRPGPKKLVKREFDAAIDAALNADEEALRQSKPGKVIASFARQVVVLALDGRPSAQRLLLSILDRDDREAAGETGKKEPVATCSAEESARELLGNRYDEFNTRFDAAVAAGSVDDLVALARDFECPDKFPQSGNFWGNSGKSRWRARPESLVLSPCFFGGESGQIDHVGPHASNGSA